MRSFASSRSLIKEISHSHGFAVRFGEYRLQQQWKAIAGTLVASHTWPTRIKFRTLHVAVDNSVWLHQLTYLKATLLENIQSNMRELNVQDILFRIGAMPASTERDLAPAGAEETNARPMSHETWKTAADCARVVQNKELRDSLTRVIALSLSAGPIGGAKKGKQAGERQNSRSIP